MVIGGIAGTRTEMRVASDQLDRFFDIQTQAVLAGSCRAAMYGQFGYAVAPVTLRRFSRFPHDLRDFDVMFVDPDLYPEENEARIGLRPHIIDVDIGNYLERTPDGRGRLCAGRFGTLTALLEPEVIRRVERPFLNTRVWTLPVGTQRYVERLVPPEPEGPVKYAASLAVFTAFAESVQTVAPDEFLSPEYYEPFEWYFRHTSH